jgi:hypothetical protein
MSQKIQRHQVRSRNKKMASHEETTEQQQIEIVDITTDIMQAKIKTTEDLLIKAFEKNISQTTVVVTAVHQWVMAEQAKEKQLLLSRHN